MPEGDSLHRAARRLEPLVGERLAVETPHPRASLTGIAARLDGRRLEGVEAVGKNLFLRFEGGLVLRSHLRMSGRWRVGPVGRALVGTPWLVLRGATLEATQWNGPVLELGDDVRARLGPDILGEEVDLQAVARRLRAGGTDLRLGEALQRQRLVAGVGNMWAAEALWSTRLSPWLRVRDVSDDELVSVLGAAREHMSRALAGGRERRRVYRHAGRPCPRCGEPIRSRGQGDANRTAYWCPHCQPGPDPPVVPRPNRGPRTPES
jgi:endonuclease VIII